MSEGLQLVRDDFSKTMNQMLTRSKSGQGALARIYPVYQRLQTNRFMTQNASEGATWEPLKPDYAKYKLKRYGGGPKRGGGVWKSWPGSGTKMLIGTGSLAGAAIGPGSPFDSAGISAHQVIFTSSSMTIRINQSGLNAEGKSFDYPFYVNQKRPFMKFSEKSLTEMKKELIKFILTGN